MAGYARRVAGKAARGRPQEHNSANAIYIFASRRRHGSRVHISEATASTCHAARRLPCSHMLVLLRGRLVKRCTRVPCHEYDGGQANDNSLDQELLKQVSIASLRHALCWANNMVPHSPTSMAGLRAPSRPLASVEQAETQNTAGMSFGLALWLHAHAHGREGGTESVVGCRECAVFDYCARSVPAPR